MKLFFYQAECGDAARLQFVDDDGVMHNVMIDSGYERTFRHVLEEEIRQLQLSGQSIDLWIVSHIHDDHIGGALKYSQKVKSGELVDNVIDWWYNPPRRSLKVQSQNKNNVSEPKSIDKGDKLYSHLATQNQLPKTDITNDLPSVDLHGLQIDILSPSASKLQRLRDKYRLSATHFERIEDEAISLARAKRINDYGVPLRKFDLSKWSEDVSIENGSSISVLTTRNHKSILWLADSHPSDVVTALRKLGFSEECPLQCNFVKVTHHGSKANNSSELYRIVDCNHYVMSVDGQNISSLPAKECMARILLNPYRNGRTIHFYFTYDTPELRRIFDVDGLSVYKDFNFETHYLKEGKYVYFDV